VVSSDEYLFVYFKTDSSASERGFNARYAQTTKCPTLARVLERDTDCSSFKKKFRDIGCGELHKVFNEEQECSWFGKTKTMWTWEFEFINDFHFKDCPGCSCEYIEFFDGRNSSSESLGRFCGSTKPDEVLTSGKYMSFTIKAGNTSEVHLKYKGKFDKKIKAAFIGGSVGVLCLPLVCLYCWLTVRRRKTADDTFTDVDDNTTDPTTDKRENNKIHEEYQLDEKLTGIE